MPTDVKTILNLTVPVIVQVGQQRLAMDDVLTLCPGAILELNKSAEVELDLMINNICIGQGVAVKVGENFGFSVTKIGSTRDLIAALGGG
jgi:flagellar motor switch protein FliN/FliY